MKKNTILIIIIAVAAIIITFAIGFSFGTSKNSETKTTQTPVYEIQTTQQTTIVTPITENIATATTQQATTTTTAAATTTTTAATTTQKPKNTVPNIQTIRLHDTISTRDFDFTLNKVELRHTVEPDNPPDYYRYYEAPDNEVYIYINAKVTNKKKTAAACDKIYSVTAIYDSGYTYRGFNITEDNDGDFTYANITDIDPLQTKGVHCLVSCPQIIETSSAPLFINIRLNTGEEFIYNIR